MATLTILSLSIHECEMPVALFRSLISLGSVLKFSIYRSYSPIKLFSRHYILFDAIFDGIFLLISFSDSLLQLYRKTS